MSLSISTEDRISSLPDPIICHILSFLSTKLAATTSVLSKRWESIWLSLPTLHFDNETFKSFSSFRNSVSNVFLSRNITLPLRSFHLISSKACNLHHSHDINRFAYAAAQRGIENLNLKICNRVSFGLKLPLSIFGCRTLVLHLHGLTANLSCVLVDFPLLKTLHLCNVHFARDQCLPKLLSGCPILEELQIKYLPRATLVLEENFQCLSNLIRANISDAYSSAANLIRWFIGYINFPTFQNLIHMELTLKHKHCEKWKWVIQVLKHCPKLQNLTIHEDSGNGNEVFGDWMDPTIVPECLSTHLRTCLREGLKSMECEVQFSKYIMQNVKVLNTISIKSASSIDINAKYQMISKIASSARASTTCELLFD